MKEYGFIYAYDIDIIVSTFYIETLQNMFFCRLPTNILVGWNFSSATLQGEDKVLGTKGSSYSKQVKGSV